MRASAQRHLNDLRDGPKRGLVWDLDAALRKIKFFEEVLHLNGGQFEGLPFKLHPSQKFRVGSLFGWKRADGTRRFRRFYDEEGKGNGKSPLLAGIGLAGMVADNEARAEIYAAGSKKDQAMVLFRDAVAMLDQSPMLAERLSKQGGNPVWQISDPESNSFFKPIASDEGQSGPRPHIALCDEIHEHRNRDMVDILERGFKWRQQPLLCMATNAGFDFNTICGEEHNHAINVARGEDENGQKVEDDQTFSFVCSLDEGDDPLRDESCWAKVNPLLGVTVTKEYLRGVVKQARAMPGKANGILRLHFCVWTSADVGWIEREEWEAIEDEKLNIEDYLGQECWGGLDIGATRDLTGRVTLFRDGWVDSFIDKVENGITIQMPVKKPKLVAFAHGYVPAQGLKERCDEDKVPYDLWVQQGHMTAVPGPVMKLEFPAKDVIDDAQRFKLMGLAYDMWLFKRFNEALDEMGAKGMPTFEHPQGFNKRKDTELWMPDSINNLEEMILERRIRVKVSPPLRAAVMAARFEESPAGLRRFSKQRATGRIDLLIALTMGAAVACRAPMKAKVPQMFFVG